MKTTHSLLLSQTRESRKSTEDQRHASVRVGGMSHRPTRVEGRALECPAFEVGPNTICRRPVPRLVRWNRSP